MSKESSSDRIKVYVLHRDVDFEFGQVVAVCSSMEKAERRLEAACLERDPDTKEHIYQRSDLSIEEHILDE